MLVQKESVPLDGVQGLFFERSTQMGYSAR